MTRLLSLSPDPQRYESTVTFDSAVLPGVSVTVRRMSLGRRIEFARIVRDLAGRLEFYQAGQTTVDRISASMAAAEIDASYLRWGIAAVTGLMIDGRQPNCEDLVASAPEPFVREIVCRIKRECGITEDERKN